MAKTIKSAAKIPNGNGHDRFVDIKLDALMYKPESAKVPVIGYLVDFIRMPDAKRNENPEWYCFVVKTTEPCQGIDRDGETQATVPGDELHVPANYMIQKKFERAALDPNFVIEVKLGDWNKRKIGGGKTMWTPRIAKVNPTARARAGFCMLPVGPNALPALGASGAPDRWDGGSDGAHDAGDEL